MRLSLGAKVRQFWRSHNHPYVAFRIPLMWYAIYHPCGIVAMEKSPYLCTQTQTCKIMAKIYVNGDAQEEREDWDSIQIKEGDKVDFLYFMGGGAL